VALEKLKEGRTEGDCTIVHLFGALGTFEEKGLEMGKSLTTRARYSSIMSDFKNTARERLPGSKEEVREGDGLKKTTRSPSDEVFE